MEWCDWANNFCFKKAGFKNPQQPVILSEYEQAGGDNLSSSNNDDTKEWHWVADVLKVSSDVTFRDYVSIDEDLVVAEYLTDEDIVSNTITVSYTHLDVYKRQALKKNTLKLIS